jgi:hypothetical protein
MSISKIVNKYWQILKNVITHQFFLSVLSCYFYWSISGVPNLFVSASPLTSIVSPHWYKCTQVNTTLRPLASPQGDASPRLGTLDLFNCANSIVKIVYSLKMKYIARKLTFKHLSCVSCSFFPIFHNWKILTISERPDNLN